MTDLQLSLYVYGKKIELSDIGCIHNLETYDNLQHILKTFDKTKVCQGSSRKLSNLKSSYGFKFVESCGMWRHLNCNIIMEKNTESGKNRLEILEIKK